MNLSALCGRSRTDTSTFVTVFPDLYIKSLSRYMQHYHDQSKIPSFKVYARQVGLLSKPHDTDTYLQRNKRYGHLQRLQRIKDGHVGDISFAVLVSVANAYDANLHDFLYTLEQEGQQRC